VSAPNQTRVLDLEAIEATLRDLQAHFPEINKLLKSRRDAIDDSLIANMMAGYDFVDSLVAQQLDLFAMGHLKLFLEMNAVVPLRPRGMKTRASRVPSCGYRTAVL
jgi:hypothetical protein